MKTSNRILVTASAITISIMSILGCSREKSAEEIYNEKASGVVMILNEYFYSVTLPTGETFYFSDIQDGKLLNVAFSQNQVKTTYSFGTGFFIDNYGGILTNRHVVNHYIKKSDVIHYVQNLLSALAAYAQERQEKAMYEGGRIYQYLRQSQYDSRYASYDEQLKQRLYELSREYDQAQNYIAQIKSISASQIAVRCHSKVGIPFNDSYVTGPSDFKPCTVEKESEDENVDLALIRLADAVTPQGAAVFSTGVDSHGKIKSTSADKLTLDQQLYLIGYNQGIALASTTEGIKAQLTSGKISQKPDQYRLLYTIPILQGSSGSPVVNSYGDLVAVNFAAVSGTQSFNFGIPIHQIRAFLGGK
ncbi:MAG: trypsin-like peptidase domain-containing protein [Bacteroidales bacterium]|nr:trypsin-like peptidase domain-containing protein [Bacteroidales bacterium]